MSEYVLHFHLKSGARIDYRADQDELDQFLSRLAGVWDSLLLKATDAGVYLLKPELEGVTYEPDPGNFSFGYKPASSASGAQMMKAVQALDGRLKKLEGMFGGTFDE